jgi:hypothetical protein
MSLSVNVATASAHDLPDSCDLPLLLLQRIETSNPVLTALEIKHLCRFQEAGCRALARALALNTRITSLDLAHTSVGPAGARVLFPALTHLTGLTYLNLHGANLQSSGASHLCNALAHLTAVAHLNLSSVEDVFSLLRSVAESTIDLARFETLLTAQDGSTTALFLADLCEHVCEQLNLPQPPDEVFILFQKGLAQVASFVVSQLRYRNSMSLVLNAAVACPVFSRQSVRAHYLQPAEQLKFKLSQRVLEIASLQLWCRGKQQRLQILRSSCPLSILAWRLACAADRHEGHRNMEQRVAALIIKRCLSHVGRYESEAFHERYQVRRQLELLYHLLSHQRKNFIYHLPAIYQRYFNELNALHEHHWCEL